MNSATHAGNSEGWGGAVQRRRSGGRRLATRLALCLVGGFIAVVLVTWILALSVDQQLSATRGRSWSTPAALDNGVRWYARGYEGALMTRIYWEIDTQPVLRSGGAGLVNSADKQSFIQLPPNLPPWRQVPSWSGGLHRKPPIDRVRPGRLYIEVGWGWPMRCLWYQYDRLGSWQDRHTPAEHAINLPSIHRRSSIQVAALPLAPAWTGLIINTILYSGVVLVLSYGWTLTMSLLFIRKRRREAGLCTECGYDLRGLEGGKCPECGATAEPRRSRPT